MAYTKNPTWVDGAAGGTLIDALHLNHMEDGIAAAATTADGAQSGLAGKADTVHTHVAADITNATVVGKSVLTAADAPAARTAIGAGTSNLVIGTTAGTAAEGNDSRIGKIGGTVSVTGTPTAGQVPTATSGTAATWQTPAASGGGFPASYSGGPVGANVYPPGCNGAGTGALIGNQPAGARLVWFPIQLGACTITGFTVNVTTAGDGASVIKVGLYDDYAGVRPKSLLTTLGTVSSTTTGTKTLTGASYAWAGGTLWVGAVEQAHTSTCAQVTNDTASFPVASSQAINVTFQAIAQDSVTSTLPANATGENALVVNRPRVWLTIQ